VASTAQASVKPSLKVLALKAISTTVRNPRSGLDDEDEGVAQFAHHLTDWEEPYLAQPPVVVAVGEQGYRLIAGERRIRAVRGAGWNQVACLVYPADLSVAQEFRLRSAENLHRQELSPLDQAVMLQTTYGLEVAQALGCEAEALALLAEEQSPFVTVQALNDLLANYGFQPTHPPVTWEQVLDRLGLAMSENQRKRLLRLLTLQPALVERLKALNLTETALRSIGQLEGEDQERLVAALEADPTLVKRLRRISRAVRDQGYSLDEALAEARGEVLLTDEDTGDEAGDDEEAHENTGAKPRQAKERADQAGDEEPSPADLLDDAVMETVTLLLDLSSQVATTLETLQQVTNGNALPEPWGDYLDVALDTLHDGLVSAGRRS
jgi:hypothetical protein